MALSNLGIGGGRGWAGHDVVTLPYAAGHHRRLAPRQDLDTIQARGFRLDAKRV